MPCIALEVKDFLLSDDPALKDGAFRYVYSTVPLPHTHSPPLTDAQHNA